MEAPAGKSPWPALAIVVALAWTSAQAQQPSPAPASTPSPSAGVSVTTPALTAPAPALSGTAAALSGTAAALTGTAAALSGTAPVALSTPAPTPPNPYSIEIDLGRQRTYLLKDGKKIAEAPVSSGRAGHLTPTGNFSVIQKDLNHFSNLYGKIVEKESGRVVKAGADVAMPVPKGCEFVPAPMKWFMRFDGATGMHAGVLPGYPASHGCVRMPASKAELFFTTVALGTPVHVFGDPPLRTISEEEPPKHAATPRPKPSPTPRPTPSRLWWHF